MKRIGSLSIVSTVDREAGVMIDFVRDVIVFARAESMSMELLLVDDFSLLATSFLEQFDFPGNLAVRLVENSRGGGQGGALVLGIMLSAGDVIVVMDPDMHENVPDIPRMLARHDEGAELVYTNRVVRRDTSALRRVLSFLFNGIIRRVTGIQAHDINTPMASVTRQAAKMLHGLKGGVESYKFQMYFLFSESFSEVDVSVSGRYREKPSNYDYLVLASLFFRRIFELSRFLLTRSRRGAFS